MSRSTRRRDGPSPGAPADGAEHRQAGGLLEVAEGLEAAGERVEGEDGGGEAGEAEDAGEPGEEAAARAGGRLRRDGGVEDAGVGRDRLLLRGDLVQPGEQDDVELLARRRLALDVGDGDLGLLELERVLLERARLALERLDPLGLDAEVEVEPLGLLLDEARGEARGARWPAPRARRRSGGSPREARSAASRCSTSASWRRAPTISGVSTSCPAAFAPSRSPAARSSTEARLGVGALGAGDGEGAADGAELVLGGRRVGGLGAEQRAALGLGPAVELADAAAEVADLAVHPGERLVGDLALPAALAGEVLVDDGIGDRRGGDRVGGGGHDLDDEGVEVAADRERGAQHVGDPRRALLAARPRRRAAAGARGRGEADGRERDAEARQARTGGAEGGGGPDRRALGVEHPEAPGGALEDGVESRMAISFETVAESGRTGAFITSAILPSWTSSCSSRICGARPVARRQPAAADPDQRPTGRSVAASERPPAPEEGLDEAAQADRPEVAPPVEADLAPRLLAGVDHAAPRRPAHSARASA